MHDEIKTGVSIKEAVKVAKELGNAPVEEWDVEHDIICIGNLIGCDLCKKGDEIGNDPICVPKMKAFRLSARTEVLNAWKEESERLAVMAWTVGMQSHGKGEDVREVCSKIAGNIRSSVTDIIKGMMNEK